MKVCVIHNLNRGGARRRMSEQVNRLAADVYEICPSTAAPITGDAYVERLSLQAPAVPPRYRIPLRYVDLAAMMRCWARVAERIERIAPDVVYANPCRFLQSPAALIHRPGRSLYFCDEARRVDYEPLAQASRRRSTRFVYGPLYRAERFADRCATARATRLATNSQYSARQIQAAYGRTATVVPMGVMAACAEAQPQEPRHLLSVGTMIPSKRHDLVIRAAAQTRRRWPVVIVAPRENKPEAQRLSELAATAGASVEIRTGISDDDLARTYAAAQATVYLAEREPLGLVSLEAQASGCPVIVAGDGGLPETLSHGDSGWIAPRDPTVIAALIDQLDDIDVRARMSDAARTHSATARWDRSAAVVEEMLSRLACRALPDDLSR